MNRLSKKLIALLTMFAFCVQLFAPAIVAAQDSKNQSSQIKQAIADYQKTYDEIMAIKQVDVGKFASFTLNAINGIQNAWSDIKGIFTKETAAQKEAREKKEAAEKYIKQIEQANKDIKQLQDDAKKTMELLKSGSLEEAASTDPTKVYESLDASSSALGIYQKALKDAGSKLLGAAKVLSKASTALSAVALLCGAISIGFPPAAPITGPIATVCKVAAIATTAAEAVIKTAGNTLVAAAERAISDDAGLMNILATEAAATGVEVAAKVAVNQSGLGVVAKGFANTAVGGIVNTVRAVNKTGTTDGREIAGIMGRETVNAGISELVGGVFRAGVGQIAEGITTGALGYSKVDDSLTQNDKDLYTNVEKLVNKSLSEVAAPAKSGITKELKVEEEKDLPEAGSEPGLNFNGAGAW